MTGVGFAEILAARARIAPFVLRTPLRRSEALSVRVGHPVLLKLEHNQTTGSFKLRGATNALLALDPEVRARGVAAASTGNHGRAVAFAAARLGVQATVCMSALVPANKVAAVEALGARVAIVGRSQDDAQAEADRLVAEAGATMIPPFDHAAVIAGQGTLGLEIVEDAPQAAAVLVPLSGGGLIAGIARAVRTALPWARVIGVSMERGAAMVESLRAGRPVAVEELPTLADSLGGGIGLDNRLTFAIVRELVDDCIQVGEAEIAEAVRHAYAAEGEILEGAAAVGIAALLSGNFRPEGPVVLVLTGRNIDMKAHRRLICGEEGTAHG